MTETMISAEMLMLIRAPMNSKTTSAGREEEECLIVRGNLIGILLAAAIVAIEGVKIVCINTL